MTIKEKKEYAFLAYTRTEMTQAEIAAKTHVQRKTIGDWIKKGNWEVFKGNIIITKAYLLRDFYLQLVDLNTDIKSREEGKRHANASESDSLSKITASIKNLETETDIATIVDVCIAINDWLQVIDFEKAKEWTTIMDSFVKERLKKY